MAPAAHPPLIDPAIPFKECLPFSLEHNSMIFICGVCHGDRFAVDFLTESGDKALHFNPRFDDKKIVRNSTVGGKWRVEEMHGLFPFEKDRAFELIFHVLSDYFKIFVNGSEWMTFSHRLRKEDIRYVEIKGEVKIRALRYQPPNPYHVELSPSGPSCSIISPAIPFIGKILGGLCDGRLIIISGIPTGTSFTINLQSGNHENCDIGLHFNARFSDAENTEAAVRNAYIGGMWGKEERDVRFFPFTKGFPFDIIIYAEHNKYKIAVDNHKFIKFEHRIPATSVDHLKIEGDARIDMIRYF